MDTRLYEVKISDFGFWVVLVNYGQRVGLAQSLEMSNNDKCSDFNF